MSGIIGCSIKTGVLNEVLKARSSINKNDKLKNDFIFIDENIICTRSHLNAIGNADSPNSLSHLHCWIEGEIYTSKINNLTKPLNSKKLSQILLDAYQENSLATKLQQLDGYFSAVIYDSQKEKILLISDRYGMKPMFYWHQENHFAWASKIKAFFSFNHFDKSLNKQAINCFIQNGHLLGNVTFFNSIHRISPATILTYSLAEEKIKTSEHYWTWSQIKPLKIKFQDAIGVVAQTLHKAIVQANIESSTKSVSLSGGLDSRAIAGALHQNNIKFIPFTFGLLDSSEVQMASKVAQLSKAQHECFEVNGTNWFNNRVESIWNSDGQCSFIHLHASQHHKAIGELSKISFNGFAGDLILGGSWLDQMDKRITKATAKSKFSEFHSLDPIENSFYDIEKEDPYFLNNRVRRFTSTGFYEITNFETRIPFLNNELIELVYSLPDKYRKNGKLYKAVLLDSFEAFFKHIPISSTLLPIKRNSWNSLFVTLSNKVNHLYKPRKHNSCFEYRNWISQKKEIFDQLFKRKNNISREFIEKDIKEIEGLQIKNMTSTEFKKYCRLITLEIYLQQVFNKAFMSTDNFLLKMKND